MSTPTTAHKDAPSRHRHRGDHVWLRELRAGEFDVLDTVFNGLSPSSRFDRFHGGIPRLSPLLRNRLSAVDGYRHVAVAAFAGREPVGIARLIALGERRAEVAVEVIDMWQGRGIGTRLLRAVTERGRTLGHTEIVADVLADNLAAQRLLASVFPVLSSVQDGPEITFIADLATGDPAAAWAA
jgi:RimJ/RimL family protein N-acetyltransferase